MLCKKCNKPVDSTLSGYFLTECCDDSKYKNKSIKT